jgi:hypothetical protein
MLLCHEMIIEISLVGLSYWASTCAVMYNRQRPPLYYGGQSIPLPQFLLLWRAALSTICKGT